jgi:hypothetical protein
MDIKSILKTVGTAVLASNPIGLAAIPIINALLPDNEKLPSNATGKDVEARIAQLTPDEQGRIYRAEIDLQIEQERGLTSRYEAMCKSDGQQTRAKIVNKAMNCLIAITLMFMCAIGYVYSTAGAKVAFSLEMAGVFFTVSGTFAYVIRAYFGDLRTETESRHSAINGKSLPSKGIAGVIQSIKQ